MEGPRGSDRACAAGGWPGSPIEDGQGRRLDTLRLSVTDRCNLRCRYCMPPEGLTPGESELRLDWDEAERLARIFVSLGIERIRITGGEPLTRPGLDEFLRRLADMDGGPELLLTTNGTLLEAHLPTLESVGIRRLNISVDSLKPMVYRAITGRPDLPRVLRAIDTAHGRGFHIKINVVVLHGLNEPEIPDFVELTRDRPFTVRFIEPMPFCGRTDGPAPESEIDGDRVLETIRNRFEIEPLPRGRSTVAARWRVPGFAGRIGIIFGHSRRFCRRCSRLRVSVQGALRTCLYGAPALDLRELLRGDASDDDIADAIRAVVRERAANGHEAEAARRLDPLGSMARIGG